MTTEENNELILTKLRTHQDLNYAIIGGVLSAVVSALIWAIITVSTKYQIGYMAIGVGLIVGFSVRYFGAGIDKVFGIIGAVFALIGCMLGNLFSQIGFIADAEGLGYYQTLTLLNFSIMGEIMAESFNPMDLLFYGIAVYEGYRFSFRTLTDELVAEFKNENYDATPEGQKFRMPLAITGIVLIAVAGFFIFKEYNGSKIYYYESGAKLSEGEVNGGK